MTTPPSARLILRDESETGRFGRGLAACARPGDLILLSGPLGAGKTSLSRAFLQAAGNGPIEVPSPTFTLVEVYDLAPMPVWHADLYRVENPAELEELGLDDALAAGVVLLEWPERAGASWIEQRRRQQLALALTPDAQQAEARVLKLEGWGGWADRLAGLVDGFTSGLPPS